MNIVISAKYMAIGWMSLCVLSSFPAGAHAAEMLTKAQLNSRVAELRAQGKRLDTLFCFRQGNKVMFQIVAIAKNRGDKEWHWAIAPRLGATEEKMRKDGYKRVSHHKFGSIHECMVWVKR